MSMKRIDRCRVCNSSEIREFLDLGKQPFANALLDNLDDEERRYPLSLSFCYDCNLVQLNETARREELFSKYVWLTGTSRTTREHLERLYRETIKRLNKNGYGYVLEIASNDGTFLQIFRNNQHEVLGIDPAKNIVDIANKNGVPTLCRFFDEKTANEIIDMRGKAMIIIARNVLPHVSDIHGFVQGLYSCLAEHGLVVIEFHYARVILEELHYDSIYHEHLCYFTFKTIERLLNDHSLFVIDAIESPISGGSLVLFVKKDRDKESPVLETIRSREQVKKINDFFSWQHFAALVQKHKRRLVKILHELSSHRIAGYGASARSSTLLNYCGIDNRHLVAIADQNLLKHDKYTPGSHVLISSLENVLNNNPSVIVVLAWNFTDEIITSLREWNFKGHVIIPLPEPRVIPLD